MHNYLHYIIIVTVCILFQTVTIYSLWLYADSLNDWWYITVSLSVCQNMKVGLAIEGGTLYSLYFIQTVYEKQDWHWETFAPCIMIQSVFLIWFRSSLSSPHPTSQHCSWYPAAGVMPSAPDALGIGPAWYDCTFNLVLGWPPFMRAICWKVNLPRSVISPVLAGYWSPVFIGIQWVWTMIWLSMVLSASSMMLTESCCCATDHPR